MIKNRTYIGSHILTPDSISKGRKIRILKNGYVFGFACVLQSLWFRCTDSLVVVLGLSCSTACGISVPPSAFKPTSPV